MRKKELKQLASTRPDGFAAGNKIHPQNHNIWPIERTQSSGWLYDVDHKVLAKISARLNLVTGLNVAKTDTVSIGNHPYGTFESEAFQEN